MLSARAIKLVLAWSFLKDGRLGRRLELSRAPHARTDSLF
jgi:hypothetical protein